MSLLQSTSKRACLLCMQSASTSYFVAGVRPLSSSSRREFPRSSPPEPKAMQADQRAQGVAALQSVLDDAAKTGVVQGSRVYKQQMKAVVQERGLPHQRALKEGQTLQPGDLHYKRMFPNNRTPRSVLTTTPLGPSKADSLRTDFLLNNGDLDPLKDLTMNPAVLSRFVTNMGKIMNRAQTKLTWKNQRRVGKAIRRARCMGVMPYFADWSDRDTKQAKSKNGMWVTGRHSIG